MTALGKLALGACAFGRAIDACGLPLDERPPLRGRAVALDVSAPAPSDRVSITVPFWTGIRVLDGLLTIGRGARIGIFGAPGAGKTTLLETLVRNCTGDAVVVALVGERGREAQRWIGRLDDRTTVVCATSDRPAQERVTAARVAVAHAAALRDRGLHVLLVFDSLARFAAASRELAVAAGESTGRGGYPPSVFAQMARLVEVAGALEHGSITLVATVINDGDDRDPVSEAARALLDGHVALCQRLAEAGRFPAVDVPASASRTMDAVADASHLRNSRRIRRALALLARIDDARSLGIEPGDRSARMAIAAQPRLDAFLYQEGLGSHWSNTLAELMQLAQLLDDDGGGVLNSVTLR
jgi:ATP synthase in type III secretion protein N